MSRGNDDDFAVGALLVELAARFADAAATGNTKLAGRWADTAFRIRGSGQYVDTERDVHEHREDSR